MRTATRFLWGVLTLLLVAWLGTAFFFKLAGGGNPLLATEPSGDGLSVSESVYTHIRELVDTLPKWDNRWNCLAAALNGKTNWSACAETADVMLAAHSNAFVCAGRIVSAPDSRWLPGMTWQRFTGDVVTLQKVGLLYRVKARAEAEHGDLAAGLETLLALGQLGLRVKRLGILPHMLGTALLGTALGDAAKPPFASEGDTAWLGRLRDMIRDMSSEALIFEAVERERDMRRAYFSAPAVELVGRHSGSWLLATLFGIPGYENYAFQSEVCIQREMEELDRLQQKIKERRYDLDYAKVLVYREPSVFRLFRRNWLGEEKLQRDGLRDFYRFLVRGRFYEISYDVALACRCYRIRHGAWPSSLGALVPDWLAAVPADPFDGQPLRYDTTNHYLWTKGADGTFDGKIDFNPYGTPIWRKAKDSRWVRFLDVEERGDAFRRTNFVFYVPGWMRTRTRDDETWHSFTNVFAGAQCTRWNQWNGDCGWKKAVRNADHAAYRLVDEVARMPDGARTNVTLVGHSLGARIVVRALAELAGKGIKVKQGILLGAAIPNDDPDLTRAGAASFLPVLAVCNPKDMTLKYAYGAAGGESAPAFGADGSPCPLENVVECPVSATVTEQADVAAAWGKSEAIRKIASHHALFYLTALQAILDGVQPTDQQLLVPQGRVNVEMKVLDAEVWWDVLEAADGWKLERNKLTGHCRILDPEKKRKAWGTEENMRKAFVKLCGQLH